MNTNYTDRVKAFRTRMTDLKVDAVLVVNPVDIRYLTGFVGDDSWALVKANSNKVTVISDFRFEEQIKKEAPQVTAVMRKKSLSETLAKRLRTREGKWLVRTLGLQSRYTTLAMREAIGKPLLVNRRVKTVKLVAVDDGLLKQRAVKGPDEVKLIRKAVAIQEEAFGAMLEYVEPGMTEAQVAAYLEFQVRTLGGDGVSFPSIVAEGANSALPHAIPGSRKIKKSSFMLIDWGAKFGGYCSDMTRVVCLGKMPGKLKEIYAICLEAQLAAIDAIKPGVLASDIDKIARDIITKAGYGKQFGHSLGHGIGLEIHEEPVLASSERVKGQVLEPGQVVTVEPGIYLPGVGGVRIEDDVLVNEPGKATGHTVLTHLPKSLESTMILDY